MICDRLMTFKTRIPMPAAFEFDRNDIELAMPMRTAGLGIDIQPVNILFMNNSHRVS